MTLIGRRDLRSNNSWMHNVEVLVKGKPRCTLHVHPDDAARLGLADGADAEVSSRTGEVDVPVEVTDAIRPGVVSIPHGWGHDLDGVELAVARRHAGREQQPARRRRAASTRCRATRCSTASRSRSPRPDARPVTVAVPRVRRQASRQDDTKPSATVAASSR